MPADGNAGDDELAWRRLDSRYTYRDRWISLRRDTVELPDGTVLDDYHTLEFPDWVNVLAFTPQLDIVLVEQWRHPIGSATLEPPSGAIDAGETPLTAIQRELREETGFAAQHWHLLGSRPANPSRQTNLLHSFLAIGAQAVGEPATLPGEIVRMHRRPWTVYRRQIVSGELPIAALHYQAVMLFEALLPEHDEATLRALLDRLSRGDASRPDSR